MRVQNERQIREECEKDEEGRKVLRMFELWHELCTKEIGRDIEVVLADRREKRELRAAKGEVNTACPEVLDGRVRMVLYFEDISNIEDVILSHEIGHWVLKLQGFLTLLLEDARFSDDEILVNSLCQHRPLYQLQRSYGLDPQPEIDKRAEHDVGLCQDTREASDERVIRAMALLFADDILSCSAGIAGAFTQVLEERHPRTRLLVEKIVENAGRYDLNTIDGSERFLRRLGSELKLAKRWSIYDERHSLRQMVREYQA